MVSGIPKINGDIGKMIQSVMLGRGQMTVEGREIEIWTRLVLDLGGLRLEIFNALDEDGYDVHDANRIGDFVHCI